MNGALENEREVPDGTATDGLSVSSFVVKSRRGLVRRELGERLRDSSIYFGKESICHFQLF